MFSAVLSKMKLPEVHIQNGKEFYLDPLREKMIQKTPEEEIRQRVIQYLLTQIAVPKNMLQVEMHLSKYGIQSDCRADIIIECVKEETKEIIPLAVVECKAPSIMLGESAVDQTLSYADQLLVEYVFITNGTELIAAKYEEDTNEYRAIEGFPTYNEMLNGKYTALEIQSEKNRFGFEEINDNLDYYVGYEFNPDTPRKYLHFITNLYECFLDTIHKIPTGNYGLFDIEQDYGIRLLSCGNASGGSYQGAYRSFLIKYNGTTRFMNLSFFDYGTDTILTVSTDQKNHKPHNSLQYAIGKNLYKAGNEYTFIHSGRIAVGKLGSGKVEELKDMLALRCPSLLINGKINLGHVTDDKLLYLDDPDVKELVVNLLSYALIRDEYRDKVIQRSKGGF